MSDNNAIKLFNDTKIRTQWDSEKEKWYFSIVDVVAVLIDNDFQGARNYWKVLKHRLQKEGNESVTNCNQLKMLASDGKRYKTDVADTEQLLRLIQSIPSKKAEPFKLWLAKVGYDRVQEIENPELGQDRIKEYYELKGYSKDWIDKRIRGIAIRQNLTDEWKKRGISSNKDFAILTAEISKATFDITPSEYKRHKNLPEKSKENLRDHMDDLELIFTMLGERVTTQISEKEKPDSSDDSQNVAKRGGKVAGKARKEAEKELGQSVVSKKNFLPKNKKLLE